MVLRSRSVEPERGLVQVYYSAVRPALLIAVLALLIADASDVEKRESVRNRTAQSQIARAKDYKV